MHYFSQSPRIANTVVPLRYVVPLTLHCLFIHIFLFISQKNKRKQKTRRFFGNSTEIVLCIHILNDIISIDRITQRSQNHVDYIVVGVILWENAHWLMADMKSVRMNQRQNSQAHTFNAIVH